LASVSVAHDSFAISLASSHLSHVESISVALFVIIRQLFQWFEVELGTFQNNLVESWQVTFFMTINQLLLLLDWRLFMLHPWKSLVRLHCISIILMMLARSWLLLRVLAGSQIIRTSLFIRSLASLLIIKPRSTLWFPTLLVAYPYRTSVILHHHSKRSPCRTCKVIIHEK
jgi:hypothetical protein